MFYKVFYTERLVPKWSAACSRACFVFVKPQYQNDIGLLQHELKHVEQFWRSPFLHGFRYLFSRDYRLACEVEAYREQLKHYPDDRSNLFARYLAEPGYRLNITLAEAQALLK